MRLGYSMRNTKSTMENVIDSSNPLVLIDIGSRGGLLSPWQEEELNLFVIGFEPDARSYDPLEHEVPNRSRQFKVGLYDQKKEMTLFLTRRPGDSSVLKPNKRFLDKFPESQRFDVVGTTEMEVDTLDSQLQQNSIDDVDFITIDTQGSELNILKGAEDILATSVFGIEIEVEFNRMYEDQPLFADVDQFLREHGFQLFDLRPIYWKRKAGEKIGGPKGQVIYADALYFREIDSLKNVIKDFGHPDLRSSKIRRAIFTCLTYGYYDYALEIGYEFETVFEPSEFSILIDEVKGMGNSRRPRIKFRGSARLARILGRLGNTLSSGSNVFSWRQIGSGPNLGNLE